MTNKERLLAIARNTSFKVSTVAFLVVVMAAIIGPSLVAAIAILAALALVATAFPIVYWIASQGDWKNSLMGQTLMGQSVIIALLVDFTFAGALGYISQTVAIILSIVLYTGLILVKINLIRVVLRVTKGRRLKKKERAVNG